MAATAVGVRGIRNPMFNRTLRDFEIKRSDVPVVKNLHNKIARKLRGGGTLEMSCWHYCKTTHCYAGWAVTLAGKAGEKLESWVGSGRAGMLIVAASCPWLKETPDFFATNHNARKEIERHACEEKCRA